MTSPGSADVPVGIGAKADEDVGAPRPGAPGSTAPRAWYSRGYLPHRDEAHLLQAITYRLADSLPQEKLRLLEDELHTLPEERRETTKREQIDRWLDAGMGCCALAHPAVARYVQNAFLHFHDIRYHLHAWCVMPNHVHVVIEPLADLATIIQSWKSFTARWVLARNAELDLGVPGKSLWMREYWDRYIRNEDHYRKVVDYIHRNPVSAGLCAAPGEWPWSSACSGNSVFGTAALGSAVPGNADVLVGIRSKADGDVGAPSSSRRPC